MGAEPATAEIEHTDDPWAGPFTEYNRYGEPTGHEYVRCRDCGAEVLVGHTFRATHRAGCRFG